MLILSGWACAASILRDGRRQIVTLYLPGDVVQADFHRRSGLDAIALMATRTADATRLVQFLNGPHLPETRPIADGWAGIQSEAAARLGRQIVRLGRMTAYERAADLFLELSDRQRKSGLAEGANMLLPLTQDHLADHLGLSLVHMNRTMQQLRRDGLIADRGGRLTVPDRQRLVGASPQQRW